jgi:hypothetical protein
MVSRMSRPVRLTLAALAFFGALFLAWLLLLVMPLGEQDWLRSLIALAAASHAARTVWKGTAEGSTSVAMTAGLGAVIVGGLGFVLGFFGPMLLAPGANQGPMLGLFITGPAGVVIGAVAGAVYARRRQAG